MRFYVLSALLMMGLAPFSITMVHSQNLFSKTDTVGSRDIPDHYEVPVPTVGGIIEDIDARYVARYRKWKAVLLSVDYGRRLWKKYSGNPAFVLRITFSIERKRGALTDGFAWARDGRLVGATITLGPQLDRGHPAPIYYPVLNSLQIVEAIHRLSGEVLAAAKMVHELGHVDQIVENNSRSVMLQHQLTPLYIERFRQNGFNPTDSVLIDLATRMGGTPTQLWERREYRSEIYSLHFLESKLAGEKYYCGITDRIRHNLDSYTGDYRSYFSDLLTLSGSQCRQWQTAVRQPQNDLPRSPSL